jgi:hypothetical protein
MGRSKIPPTNDLLVKKVFASPQFAHILMGLIKDVLG